MLIKFTPTNLSAFETETGMHLLRIPEGSRSEQAIKKQTLKIPEFINIENARQNGFFFFAETRGLTTVLPIQVILDLECREVLN